MLQEALQRSILVLYSGPFQHIQGGTGHPFGHWLMIMAPMQRKAGDSGNDGDDDVSIWLGGHDGNDDVNYNDDNVNDESNDDCDDDDYNGVGDVDDHYENSSLSI